MTNELFQFTIVLLLRLVEVFSLLTIAIGITRIAASKGK